MSLTPGTRIGAYEVLSSLGAGGMGEEYRARDTKLDRDVALKILPESFASDPDRLMRFEREAKTLASLNHPNIAAIYGLEERALVMELVEGEDLSAQIARGPISIDEALPIARQIAAALEAAHEQGIIHRDLKPANIKVRADDTVKVLDLGLAKALDQGSGSGIRDQASREFTHDHAACNDDARRDSWYRRIRRPSVALVPGPTFTVGKPSTLFSLAGVQDCDVAAEGRVILIRSTEAEKGGQLIVIEDFFEELRQTVPR